MEEWKLVEKNRQTIWEVSSEGRIKKNGVIVPPRKGLAYGRYVRLKSNSMLHRVIAELFIPNPQNLPQVNHIDGNKENNKVENLEWVTSSENASHSYQNNLQVIKLDKESRTLLIEVLKRKESPTVLAKQFGISLRNVYYYKNLP